MSTPLDRAAEAIRFEADANYTAARATLIAALDLDELTDLLEAVVYADIAHEFGDVRAAARRAAEAVVAHLLDGPIPSGRPAP